MKLSLQHIHLVTHDKKILADWYCKYLGFKFTDDLEERGEPGGPIMITADDGKTSISIFSRDRPIQNIFPAFESSIEGFLELHQVFNSPRIYDHYRFFSLYIKDPDQNKIEVCVTDYETLKAKLNSLKIDYCFMTPETYTP